MDLTAFAALLTPEGTTALTAAADLVPTEPTLLACLDRLRKCFPPDLAQAALETVVLRCRARSKFTKADSMFFTREALEQASAECVATYRAVRFAELSRVADLCCGIGGDLIGIGSIAFAVGIDADPLRLAMAAHNIEAYGVRATCLNENALTVPLAEVDAAFADPDRRRDGRRTVSVQDCEPSLSGIVARFPAGFPLGVKLAPATPWSELAAFDAEAEFISLDGELKECVLWFGPLRTTARRATVLPGPHSLAAETPAPPREPGPPKEWLYDPDPAVTRAGLVADLAERIEARPIDAEIAFLTADAFRPTPFARAYRVEEWMPFQLKRLAERLRNGGVGRVTVLKRGSAVDVGELTRRLKLRGDTHRVVVLTRVLGNPAAILCVA